MDAETDGFLDDLTTIHCLVLRDLDSDVVVSCTDNPRGREMGYRPIEEGLTLLKAAERVYGHNIIEFDYPAVRKVRPDFVLRRDQIADTQVIAQMRWAHIAPQDYDNANKQRFPANLAGLHTLEAWGHRLGKPKIEYTEWCKQNGIEEPFKEWRPEMQTYCEGDTETTKLLVAHIRKFPPSQEAIDIEHELAWYLAAQRRCGVPFDIEKAIALQGRLAARRVELETELQEAMGPLVIRDGKPFTPKKDDKKRGYVAGCPFQKIKIVQFNPGSRQHIERKLRERFGWVPTEFTDGGKNAKVDEKTLKGLNTDIPAVKLLMEYLLVEKRLGQIVEGKEGWMTHARTDGTWGGKVTGLHHIHGRVKQNHAITHRASHASPNMSAVPKVGKPFGQECRELFYVPEGWVMVGADASSLEARCLAHRMARWDGGAYGKLLLEGDVHTANRIALGLPGEPEIFAKVARDGSKTFFYAFLYGGGDEKLGTIVVFLSTPDGTRLLPAPKGGWTPEAIKKLGKKKRQQFLNNTPALKYLIEEVQKVAKERGYFFCPDGRKVYVRSQHAALNTLLQSDGAIIVKRWIANFSPILHRELGGPGWNGQWVPLLWSHDEVQIAVREEHAKWLCDTLVSEMRKITDHFKWRVPLDGEAKVGRNWAETH